MTHRPSFALLALIIGTLGCNAQGSVSVPRTETFPTALSTTGIFRTSSLASLEPAEGYHVVELQSALFSDGAQKQRLLHVPAGTKIRVSGDGLPEFPEGTTLVKTFFYNHNDRDPSLGRQVIETRLLTLEQDLWNVATYVWNEEQTDASLSLDGSSQAIDWTSGQGDSRSIDYQVPNERQCVSCHQLAGDVTPLGPELRNLNLTVTRNGVAINQLDHLQAVAALEEIDPVDVDSMVDYLDTSLPISPRGRAYLDVNCAHCHQPQAWSRPAREGYDFRWEISTLQTGLVGDEQQILQEFRSGRMPFLGTTIIDEDGLAILTEYLRSVDESGTNDTATDRYMEPSDIRSGD